MSKIFVHIVNSSIYRLYIVTKSCYITYYFCKYKPENGKISWMTKNVVEWYTVRGRAKCRDDMDDSPNVLSHVTKQISLQPAKVFLLWGILSPHSIPEIRPGISVRTFAFQTSTVWISSTLSPCPKVWLRVCILLAICLSNLFLRHHITCS